MTLSVNEVQTGYIEVGIVYVAIRKIVITSLMEENIKVKDFLLQARRRNKEIFLRQNKPSAYRR